MNNIKAIIPLLILLVLLFTGIFYYNSQNKKNDQAQSGGSSVLGAKDSTGPTISTDEYSKTISDIRQPINKKIEDLIPKLKYTTLFQINEIIDNTNEIKSMIDRGLQKFSGLNISSDLKQTNDKQIESLNDLKDAMNALIAMQKASDKTEKQKQSELFSYKIDESNRAIQSGASTNNSSNSGNSNSTNAINPLQ